jgi:hypothetical protein
VHWGESRAIHSPNNRFAVSCWGSTLFFPRVFGGRQCLQQACSAEPYLSLMKPAKDIAGRFFEIVSHDMTHPSPLIELPLNNPPPPHSDSKGLVFRGCFIMGGGMVASIGVILFIQAASVLGASMTIATWLGFREIRSKMAYYPIVMLAISDLLLTLPWMAMDLKLPPVESWVCPFAGAILQTGSIGSCCWCLVIARIMYMTVQKIGYKHSRLELALYTLFAFGLPVFTALIPFSVDAHPYKHVPLCYFNLYARSGLVFVFINNYTLSQIPVWCCILGCIILMILTYRRLNATTKAVGVNQDLALRMRMQYRRLVYYPGEGCFTLSTGREEACLS